MNDIIIYKYFYKDILIELNIDYFHVENMLDSEFVKYSNIFNILDYYNIFNKSEITLNIYDNPKDTLEFLINLSHKYNNTQQVLLICYSYILSYFINKDGYNLNSYQNRFYKKYKIDYKKELSHITNNTLELSILEYKFLDEFYRYVSKYPGIKEYHQKAIKTFDLVENNLLFNNKLVHRFINKKLININNTSLIDDDIYLDLKQNIIKIIKEFNSKLY